MKILITLLTTFLLQNCASIAGEFTDNKNIIKKCGAETKTIERRGFINNIAHMRIAKIESYTKLLQSTLKTTQLPDGTIIQEPTDSTNRLIDKFIFKEF